MAPLTVYRFVFFNVWMARHIDAIFRENIMLSGNKRIATCPHETQVAKKVFLSNGLVNKFCKRIILILDILMSNLVTLLAFFFGTSSKATRSLLKLLLTCSSFS